MIKELRAQHSLEEIAEIIRETTITVGDVAPAVLFMHEIRTIDYTQVSKWLRGDRTADGLITAVLRHHLSLVRLSDDLPNPEYIGHLTWRLHPPLPPE